MGQAFDRVEVERLVNLYSDLILRVSYSYLKSTHDAQDICQTVFLKVLTGKPDFRSAEHEKAWIIRTTINACKDLLGSAWRSRTCGMEACAEAAAPEVGGGNPACGGESAAGKIPDGHLPPLLRGIFGAGDCGNAWRKYSNDWNETVSWAETA